jgi:hypothetical protein
VCREILSSLLSPQFQEKKWKELLLQFVKFLLSAPLPIEPEIFMIEVVSERTPSNESSTQLFASLQILLLLLSTESALQMKSWVPQALTLVGRLVEIIATRANAQILSKSVHEITLLFRR